MCRRSVDELTFTTGAEDDMGTGQPVAEADWTVFTPKGLLLAVLLAKVLGAVKETCGLPKPCAGVPLCALAPKPAKTSQCADRG